MIRDNITDLYFQTFYISRETSRSPLLTEIIRANRRFKEQSILENAKMIISLRYGKRILINGNYSDSGKLDVEDFLEIVDYDPIKKIVLAIGQNEPCIETPLHWLIHHARNDVNAIIQLNGENILSRKISNIPITENDWAIGTIELVKEVLKKLRNSKKILIKNIGALFVGLDLKEAETLALETCKESL